VGDSNANGVAERAVQSVEEMVRVLKLALEGRVKSKVSVTHKVFPWLVEHAADILTKFVVGRDGRTAFERARGHKYTGEMLEFGTPIMHRAAGKTQGGLVV
jgi:hypothetical protein